MTRRGPPIQPSSAYRRYRGIVGIVVVLENHWNPVEWADEAVALERRVELARTLPSGVVHGQNRAEAVVVRVDPCQIAVDERLGGDAASGDGVVNVRNSRLDDGERVSRGTGHRNQCGTTSRYYQPIV